MENIKEKIKGDATINNKFVDDYFHLLIDQEKMISYT